MPNQFAEKRYCSQAPGRAPHRWVRISSFAWKCKKCPRVRTSNADGKFSYHDAEDVPELLSDRVASVNKEITAKLWLPNGIEAEGTLREMREAFPHIFR